MLVHSTRSVHSKMEELEALGCDSARHGKNGDMGEQ